MDLFFLVKKYKFIIIGIFVLTALLIGSTYAWINIEISGTKTNKLIAGTLSMELDESTCTAIDVDNAVPITDEEGMRQIACTFTLENTGNLVSGYSLYLDDVELSDGKVRMNDSDIKYSLIKNEVNTIGLFSDLVAHPDRVIDNGTLAMGESHGYELRFWIDKDANNSAMGKVISVKLRVKAEVSYKPIDYNLSDFYVYEEVVDSSYSDYGLNKVSLNVDFKSAIENNSSYTDSLGNVWNNGDPLPNPGSEFELNGVIEPVESMSSMFTSMTIETIDLSLWDTSNIINMSEMFSDSLFLNLNLSSFNTSKVINMNSMFARNEELLNLDLSSFQLNENVFMSGMFSCSNPSLVVDSFDDLTYQEYLSSGDLGNC